MAGSGPAGARRDAPNVGCIVLVGVSGSALAAAGAGIAALCCGIALEIGMYYTLGLSVCGTGLHVALGDRNRPASPVLAGTVVSP